MELSQKSLTGIQKFFSFQVPSNIQTEWKAKLESAYSFMLKYYKITMWYHSQKLKMIPQSLHSKCTLEILGLHIFSSITIFFFSRSRQEQFQKAENIFTKFTCIQIKLSLHRGAFCQFPFLWIGQLSFHFSIVLLYSSLPKGN